MTDERKATEQELAQMIRLKLIAREVTKMQAEGILELDGDFTPKGFAMALNALIEKRISATIAEANEDTDRSVQGMLAKQDSPE